MRLAAWRAYLVYNKVYNETYLLLRKHYDTAVEFAGFTTPGDRFSNPERALASHVTTAFARGLEDLGEPTSVISKFINNAPPTVISDAISSVGRSLHRDAVVPADISERLECMFEAIIARCDTLTFAQREVALGSFGWWFTAARQPWGIGSLLRTLSATGGTVEPMFRIVPKLAELSQSYPFEAAKALEMLSRGESFFKFVYSNLAAIKTILESSVRAGGAAKRDAVRINNRLMDWGSHDFAVLFRGY